MEAVFELLARSAFKGLVGTLASTPVHQWGAVQWGAAAAILALVSGLVFFVVRSGVKPARSSRRASHLGLLARLRQQRNHPSRRR